jgi:predicted PurR-regulated permease PerM/methylmalonyl-CoA mutase cobalamin-binding subunit
VDPVRKNSRLLAVVATLVAVAALYFARGVLIPFALAVLVSFVLAPLVACLHRWKVPRALAVFIAVLALLTVAGGAGWVIVGQARDLAARLPEYRENTRHKTWVLREIVGKPIELAASTVKDMGTDFSSPTEPSQRAPEPQAVRVVEPSPGAFQALRNLLDPVLGALSTIVMALLFAVVMLLRPEDLRDRFIRLVGNGQIYVTTQAIDDASLRVSRYLIRQLFVNCVLGVTFGLGLMLIGVPDALLWGFLLALLRFIPYVGVWLAALLPVFLSFIISDGWTQPLEAIGVFALVEMIGSFVIEPWLYGQGTGISPLAVLLSALFWSWLWGPIGLVLATPLTVCLVVMGKYVPQLSFLSLLFSDAPALPAPARLYQRLLAQDQDEAWAVVKEDVGANPPLSIIDSTVLPALALAEEDLQKGSLEAESAAQIRENVQILVDEMEDADALAAAQRPVEEIARLAGLRVLCLPAHSETDALAATMLERQLQNAGATVDTAPLAELMGETLKNLKQHPVDVVIVSAVPPTRLMHVRYVCKRLAKVQGLQILVGVWTLDIEAPGIADRLPTGANIRVVSTFEQAIVVARQLAVNARIVRSAAS